MEINIKTEEKEIDGNKYKVSAFAGRESFKIKIKLVKLLAPAMAVLVDSLGKKDSIADVDIMNIDFEKVGDAVLKLTEHMSEDDFVNFVLRMLSKSRKNGVEITASLFDLEFAGNLTTVYKLLFFVIQVNYPDFFQLGASITNLNTGDSQQK